MLQAYTASAAKGFGTSSQLYPRSLECVMWWLLPLGALSVVGILCYHLRIHLGFYTCILLEGRENFRSERMILETSDFSECLLWSLSSSELGRGQVAEAWSINISDVFDLSK